MALPLSRRTVHYYEVEMRSYTRAAVKNPATATFAAMLKCFNLPKLRLPIGISEGQRATTSLADVRYDDRNGWYELLINKADADLSDVAFRDLKTAATRKAGKTRSEGIELSSHVMIRPNADGHRATVLLTMGAGVSIKHVTTLLKTLAKVASKQKVNQKLFYFDEPSGAKDADGKPKQYRVSYTFLDYAYKSQTLTKALESGEFESMELIAHENKAFDSGGNLKIDREVLRVTAAVPESVKGATVTNAVSEFRKKSDAQHFDTLRIRYKNTSGNSATAKLDISALDGAFTQKEHINFDVEVDGQQTTLSQEILAEMRSLMEGVAR